MYKVYFNDKVIIFDTNTEKYNAGDTILFSAEAGEVPAWDALREETLPRVRRAVVVSDDPKTALEKFFETFRVVKAGGGVVRNAGGEIAMIYRWERWDLPKGKLEAGEALPECARREVSEECGLEPEKITIERAEPLTETFHIYCMNGEWLVKDTTWYAMRYAGDARPTPQTEEGITAIAWVTPDGLAERLQTSYFTIRDVFEASGYGHALQDGTR